MILEAKEIAKQDTKVALQKATDAKQNPELNTGKTATGQVPNPIDLDPMKAGMEQSQTNS
jgi:hypothetical protein